MTNWRKVAGISACLILFVGLILISPLLFLVMMFIAGSERTIYERAESPDGFHEARVQFDDAGAISGYQHNVFIKNAWNPSDAPLLSCRAFSGYGQAEIDLLWQDASTLVIAHHVAPENVAGTKKSCGSVQIIAEPTLPFEDY